MASNGPGVVASFKAPSLKRAASERRVAVTQHKADVRRTKAVRRKNLGLTPAGTLKPGFRFLNGGRVVKARKARKARIKRTKARIRARRS